MMARMLAKHYGFTCKVFITIDPKTGFINPGSSDISGLEALKTADLLVIFLRFQDFPDDQMQHIVDYIDRGGPVVGILMATHAFQIKRPDAKFVNNTREPQGCGLYRRLRTSDPWRDVGVALRRESQAELAAIAADREQPRPRRSRFCAA